MTSPSRSVDESVTQPHSPLPWTVGDILHLSAKVDAEYAVKACNYHDRLAAALRFLVDAYGVGSTPALFVKAIEDEMPAARALLAEIERAER